MSNSEKEIPTKNREILLNHARETLSTQRIRLGDLSQKDNKGHLAFGCILTFWCADAIIRMIGVKEERELAQSSWWQIYDEAVLFAERLNLENLEKLYMQSGSAKGIWNLIIVRTDVVAIQQEIADRFKCLTLAPKFIKYLERGGIIHAKEFLEQVARGIGGWHKKEAMDSIKSFRDALRVPLEIITPYKDDAKEPTEIKMENLLNSERRTAALVRAHEYYEDLKKAVDIGNWQDVSFTLMDFLPANNPQWERVAPWMLQEEIRVNLKNRLPILDGDIERIPFELYNADWADMRREFGDHSVFISKESLEELKKDEEEKNVWDAIEFIFRSEGKKEAPFEDEVDVRSQLREILGPKINLDKAIGALELMLKGTTEEQAAKEKGLTERTLRNYLKKIEEFYPHNKPTTE